MSSQRPTVEQEYDVFVKESGKGWCFNKRVKANSLQNAKEQFMRENVYLSDHFVTVYPRR